jgi:hypothetical protein
MLESPIGVPLSIGGDDPYLFTMLPIFFLNALNTYFCLSSMLLDTKIVG